MTLEPDPTRLPGICRTDWCVSGAGHGPYCGSCAAKRRAGRPNGAPPGPRHGEWWVDLDRLAAIVDAGADALAATGWRDHARCAGQWDLFYNGAHNARAKRICSTCPALYACLADAVIRKDEHGVVGGTTREERSRVRRAIRAHRRAAAGAA